MISIEFHDREREIEDVMRILKAPPNLITFVYGPINSGKSSLMNEIVKKLKKSGKYTVFCIDLRERFIKDYGDFIRVLFKVHRTKISDYRKFLAKALEDLTADGLPIPKNLLVEFLKRGEVEDVFEYIVTVFETVRKKGRIPVLVLDELQVIGDLKIDDLLIYRLFNLFVSITKKRHLAHVFAVTSDSLFMERVYTEASLHGRCRYLLVDDFDHSTAVEFLRKHGFSEDEIKLTWEYFGGKPVYLVEAVKERDRLREFCEEMLRIRKRQIKDSIYSLDEDFRHAVLEILAQFREEEKITYEYLTEELVWCMKNNILFLDPVNELVKPQSRLDLLALRRLLEELE